MRAARVVGTVVIVITDAQFTVTYSDGRFWKPTALGETTGIAATACPRHGLSMTGGILRFLGGIGLFLFGMETLTAALRSLAGEGLQRWLLCMTLTSLRGC